MTSIEAEIRKRVSRAAARLRRLKNSTEEFLELADELEEFSIFHDQNGRSNCESLIQAVEVLKHHDLSFCRSLLEIVTILRPDNLRALHLTEQIERCTASKKNGCCELNGMKFHFGNSPSFQVLNSISSGKYEKEEVALVQKHLDSKDVVLELGSGIGYMAVTAVKKGFCSKYFGYEANPDLIEVIEKNMKANNVQFEIRNEVLGDEDGSLPFYLTPSFWSSSLLKPESGDFKEVKVRSVEKNQVMRLIKPTALIVDIEGGEAQLFQDLDLSSVRKIILEVHPAFLTDKQLSKLDLTILNQGFLRKKQSMTDNVVFWYREKPSQQE